MAAKTVIAIGKGLQLQAVQLRHPVNDCPAVATPVKYYHVNGRNVGLVLLFPDGHTASLTYAEIGALQGYAA